VFGRIDFIVERLPGWIRDCVFPPFGDGAQAFGVDPGHQRFALG
jgi:hypothetical protein